MGALCRWWNRTGFTPAAKLDRYHTTRHILRQSSTSNPPGRGNKAWKRAAALDRGAFHLAGNVWIQ